MIAVGRKMSSQLSSEKEFLTEDKIQQIIDSLLS
jgi:hypothetical protein